jgi:hypothetical protein
MRGWHTIVVICCAVTLTLAAGFGFSAKSDHDFDRAIYLLWITEGIIVVCYLWWLFGRERKLKNAAAWGMVTLAILVTLPLYALPTIAARRGLFSIEQENAELLKNSPELFPDNKPSPLSICPIGVGISMGGNFFGGVEFPFTALSIRDTPILVLDMTPKGLVASFDVRDNEGNILARVQRNVVDVHARGRINPRRSLHRLSLIDEKGTSVLDLEYVNQNAISIYGKFFIAPHIYVLMNETGTHELDSRTNQELISISSYIGCDVDVGLNL